MAKNGVDELSGKQFDDRIKNGTVIIDFFADWCLTPKTKLIFNPCIKNIENAKVGSKILSFDKNFKEIYSKIKSVHKILSNKKLKITTERGREIICTPEHLILTNKGFSNAENLSRGDLVASYLFSSYPYIENDKRIFINEEKIRKTARKLRLEKQRYIDELKERNLLSIKYNDERAYILANLIGLLLSDGSLSIYKNNERATEFFIERAEDEKEVIKDLKLLGFDASSRNQISTGKINNREFVQKIIRIRVLKTSLFILLNSLGGIVGEKFVKGLKLPEWIIKGPKEIQRAFLQGFLGGDGPRIRIKTIERKDRKFYNRPFINPIEFHFYSNAENSPKNFIEGLSYILNNFNVKVRKIEIQKENRYKRKDQKSSLLLKISLNSNFESAYAYASIGFKYSYSKKLVSSLTREYLLERLIKIREREKKRLQTIQLKNKLSISEIAKKLNLSYSIINNWLSGKKAFPPRDVIRYDKWLKLYTKPNKNIIFDKIQTVKNYNGKNYPFISLSLNNNTKMFVANELIHHNCMPCLMMAPVIEELAEKFKDKIEFAKLNVDENQKISQKFKVMSIPTFIVFKNGKEIGRITGSMPAEVLEERIKKII